MRVETLDDDGPFREIEAADATSLWSQPATHASAVSNRTTNDSTKPTLATSMVVVRLVDTPAAPAMTYAK